MIAPILVFFYILSQYILNFNNKRSVLHRKFIMLIFFASLDGICKQHLKRKNYPSEALG